ncbi:MAG: adenylate/guanylate cyclase domain-containing protein [Gammaproteobacteria bacterium]|nr:adenylate/guanylate cyclase domain-containing protein [Gammaproteobacteria bacterium]
MRRWERRLRNWSGLLLATFVCLHLINHSSGLISLQAAEQIRSTLAYVWRSLPGTVALYGALVTHFALALMSLYRRTTLRMPLWEGMQLWLGLSILPLLSGHIVGTRGGWTQGKTIDYATVVNTLASDPWLLGKQLLVLGIVWAHMLVGLHYWLRLRRNYRRTLAVLYPLALLIPLLAVLGFAGVAAELEAAQPSVQHDYGAGYSTDYADVDASADAGGFGLADLVLYITLALIGATLVARQLRVMVRLRSDGYRLRHANGQTLTAPRGRSILEALRMARIPHASVCGGRARCTTCRVRVGEGLDQLPRPNALETAALQRIAAAPNVRLACQTRPLQAVQITPLLAADTLPGDRRKGGVHGRERAVAALFVDLRGSTKLGESKLPYDVLFILNQFFAEMAAALHETDGHYAQFNGDGLLALYGLKGGARLACRNALAGAVRMHRHLEQLNQTLAGELEQPLRIGVGIHHGNAIVGSMGPPESPIVSAIGDTINLAARLEALSKDYACNVVASADVFRRAEIRAAGFMQHRLQVRGKQEAVDVHAIGDVDALANLLDGEAVIESEARTQA